MIPIQIYLFVNPSIVRHQTLIRNLQRVLKQKTYAHCDLQVIDVIKEPDTAIEEQIYILPTLVRKYPDPEIRIIGDFADLPQIIDRLAVQDPEYSAMAGCESML
jgi:circadian clock protein KaiB